MRVLVTGGAGYIGSHTCVLLLEAGHQVTVIDNFSNSTPSALSRVEAIAGRSLRFVDGDLRDYKTLDEVFRPGIDAVIHFAALKAVGESWTNPLAYFDNNVGGAIALLQAMERHGVSLLIFSSSATVYGTPDSQPVEEDAPARVTNPYGRSKVIVEQLLQDWCAAHDDASVVALRYFNPVGAHSSGLLGEEPRGTPNNLMPYVAQVASGVRDHLGIHGSDYPTPDGTGVRDYVHVVDVADAHVSALSYCAGRTGYDVFNIGCGRGYSVLEVVDAFQEAARRPIALRNLPRRKGDVAELVANTSKIERVLGWKAVRGLREMCVDAWNWELARIATKASLDPSNN